MAANICSNVPNPSFVKLFDDRLKRIVEESYEVAFVLCNREMEEFSSSKIFDIFSQIFTTAYVLNTGYWPFFSTTNGQCLCVCGRFGIPCRHIKNGSHWIDLQPIESDPKAPVFYPKLLGPVTVQNYEVFINPLDSAGGYQINIIMNVQYKRSEKGKSGKDDITLKTYPISIYSRFYLMNQFYSAWFTIVFQPNPFFNKYYGSIFKKLFHLRTQEFSTHQGEQRQIWCIADNQMPSTTFIYHHVNVPIYKFPSQLLVLSTYSFKSKALLMKNKSVQTQTAETFPNPHYWDTKLTGDMLSISDSLKSFASTPITFIAPNKEEFIFIDDSEEFDNQWPSVGYNKTIQPNQQLVQYNALPSTLLVTEPEDLTSKSQLSIWSPKTEPDSTTTIDSSPDVSLVTTEESFLNINLNKELISEEKNKRWLEKSFPPLPLVKREMDKSEVDEEFEIIQNVIRDDVLKEEGNLDWWNKNIKQ